MCQRLAGQRDMALARVEELERWQAEALIELRGTRQQDRRDRLIAEAEAGGKVGQ